MTDETRRWYYVRPSVLQDQLTTATNVLQQIAHDSVDHADAVAMAKAVLEAISHAHRPSA